MQDVKEGQLLFKKQQQEQGSGWTHFFSAQEQLLFSLDQDDKQ